MGLPRSYAYCLVGRSMATRCERSQYRGLHDGQVGDLQDLVRLSVSDVIGDGDNIV